MKNIRTTVAAVVTLLAVIAPKFLGYDLDAETQVIMVTVGVTLIGFFSKDSNVTGGTKHQ